MSGKNDWSYQSNMKITWSRNSGGKFWYTEWQRKKKTDQSDGTIEMSHGDGELGKKPIGIAGETTRAAADVVTIPSIFRSTQPPTGRWRFCSGIAWDVTTRREKLNIQAGCCWGSEIILLFPSYIFGLSKCILIMLVDVRFLSKTGTDLYRKKPSTGGIHGSK
jgi:hypothetical protein